MSVAFTVSLQVACRDFHWYFLGRAVIFQWKKSKTELFSLCTYTQILE